MNIEISELKQINYILKDKLTHAELPIFLNDKLKLSKKWFFYIYMILLISPLGIISYTITKNLITKELSIINCIVYLFLGIVEFMFLFGLTMLILHSKKLMVFTDIRPPIP